MRVTIHVEHTLSSDAQQLLHSALANDGSARRTTTDHETDTSNDVRKYAPHSTGISGLNSWVIDDTRDPWLKDHKHLTETAFGKAGIEFVSRFTLGAVLFSLMENSSAMSRMRDYQRNTHTAKVAAGEARFLEKAAYIIDTTLGPALFKTLSPVYGKGKAHKLLKFRENRLQASGQLNLGRSLGAEMTVVTASFAAMSTGSALFRNLLNGIFNPNERKSWTNNGKFNPLHIIKKTAGKLWQVVTYNAGEDVAAALPYVFFMRAWRNLVNKAYPGFKYSSDNVDNGGGVVLNNNNKVSGHFLSAGFWDLQGRFTVYNVFTRQYRDLYQNIGSALIKWKESNFSLSTPNFIKHPTTIPKRVLGSITGFARYLFISTAESLIQMTPSVPFFSIFRVSASKNKGLAVHPENGALFLIRKSGQENTAISETDHQEFLKNCEVVNGKWKWNTAANADAGYMIVSAINAGKNIRIDGVSHQDPAYGVNGKPLLGYSDGQLFSDSAPTDSTPSVASMPYRDRKNGEFEAYGFSKKGTDTERGRRLQNSPLANATDHIGSWVDTKANSKLYAKAASPIFSLFGYKSKEEHQDLARGAILAAIPYASYFSMKVLMRDRINEQMNESLGRVWDGFWKFNMKEVRAGIGDVNHTLIGLPLEDPEMQARLIENHRRNPMETSPIPIDWDKNMHRQYLEDISTGATFTTHDLTRILNKERADYYTDQTFKHMKPDEEALSKEQIADFIKRSDENSGRVINKNELKQFRIIHKPKKPTDNTKRPKNTDWKSARKEEVISKEMDEVAAYV